MLYTQKKTERDNFGQSERISRKILPTLKKDCFGQTERRPALDKISYLCHLVLSRRCNKKKVFIFPQRKYDKADQ